LTTRFQWIHPFLQQAVAIVASIPPSLSLSAGAPMTLGVLALLVVAGCGGSRHASPGEVEPGGQPYNASEADSASETEPSDGSLATRLDGDMAEASASPGDAADSGSPDTGGLPGVDAGRGPSLASPYGPNLVSIFDGVSLTGWTVVVDGKVTNANPVQWSVVDGAMHSSGANRNFIYSANKYGDFRLIFTSRLISDLADGNTPHVPCVLFWGTSTTADAMDGLQIQPPKGYMWDYRQAGPTSNKSPSVYETEIADPHLSDTGWSQCEMLANVAAGAMRFACCQLTDKGPCKATEVVDFKEPTAGQTYYLAFQVHTGKSATGTGQIEEFKDIYVESPVADPAHLVTTQ
jgi:Domain of Unknown Function (DUF1080)